MAPQASILDGTRGRVSPVSARSASDPRRNLVLDPVPPFENRRQQALGQLDQHQVGYDVPIQAGPGDDQLPELGN
jgi:hypothetical protein